MKTPTLSILAMSMAMRFAWGQGLAPEVAIFVENKQQVISLKGRKGVASDMKEWLTIEAYNPGEWKQNGFDPRYTRVLCDYEPKLRHLPNGQWEIVFRPEN